MGLTSRFPHASPGLFGFCRSRAENIKIFTDPFVIVESEDVAAPSRFC